MENSERSNKKLAGRKICLILGAIFFVLSVFIFFPIESSKSNFLEDLPMTFSALFTALILLMIGFMGKHFFKGILFLLLSGVVGYFLIYFGYPLGQFSVLAAFWLGIPSGIVAALIFLVVNYYFLIRIKTHKIIKKIVVYLIILLIVAILFGYGGDWYFEFTEYLKNYS